MNRIKDGGVVETVVTDEALQLAHEGAQKQQQSSQDLPKGLTAQQMAAFKKTKAPTAAQNERSKRIVEGLRIQREQRPAAVEVSPQQQQTTFAEFGIT